MSITFLNFGNICLVKYNHNERGNPKKRKREKEMKHEVRVYTNNKVTKREFFETAEKAYERYIEVIGILRRTAKYYRETNLVARFNEGDLMTMEEIK